jgi:hypothetical protein
MNVKALGDVKVVQHPKGFGLDALDVTVQGDGCDLRRLELIS